MQASLFGNVDCPFLPYLEDGDTHCFEPISNSGYEVISEDHPDFDLWLAEVGNIGFESIIARPNAIPLLPDFIPDVGGGNGKLFVGQSVEYAATTLARAVTGKRPNVAADIHKVVNLPQTTTVLVLGYAEDTLLERIWAERYDVIPKLARLNCIFTAPDYSVFLNQPHPERLINMKRSLIIFDMLQKKGALVIPHMHWFGPKDLQRWAVWINQNMNVSTMAIDLQMLTSQKMWDEALVQLGYFVKLLKRKVHFVVSGPSTPERIAQINKVLRSTTITSALPIQTAIRHRKLTMNSRGRISRQRSRMQPSQLLQSNMSLMNELAQGWNSPRLSESSLRIRKNVKQKKQQIVKPLDIVKLSDF